MTLRVLHTSDWHLGRSLYGHKRYEEFDRMLDWMVSTIETELIDVLLIAGDIFDTTTPSNRAMQQYYDFLRRVSATQCQHIVIIGGNHDSPTFLNAPRQLLQALNVHVVGAALDDPADEVLLLRDSQQQPMMIVCAVPYLRDRDIRQSEAGESMADKEQKLLSGIALHYQQVVAAAETLRAGLGSTETSEKKGDTGINVPIIGMGHLFTAGAQTVEDDGVRDLYVGSLAHVGPDIFPSSLDYVALGHLHVPQAVGGNTYIRYSGSPLPMGFGEATQQKSVCRLEFQGREPQLKLLPVPVFQRLRQCRGDLETLQDSLRDVAELPGDTWVELVYTNQRRQPELREKLEAVAADVGAGRLTVLRIKHPQAVQRALSQTDDEQTLDELTPEDVFERCLSQHEIPMDERDELRSLYSEIVNDMQTADRRAE
ncbi:MAG: exonuclease SbcCD subunit D C-terminal domain-containing protein [Pseudomonadota bacterium]|nr:exonuclease SbcCD subunit D C-terminal domain-containing protein [Pseudomonadota bacterium]